MIISKEFYDQCCPSYKKAINELEKNIAKIDENQKDETKGQQIINVILNFSQSNLTPKEYWEHLLNNSYKYLRDPEIWKNRCTEILNKAYFHFYYNKEWNCEGSLDCGDRLIFGYKNKNLKLMDFQKSYYFERAIPFYCITEGDINYPHDCLKIRFREFEQSTTQLPSAKIFKRYEKMMELYPKIKAAENDVETWFKLLFEVDDVSFVKDNVECRLGQDLLNLRLRKLYLTFLKEQGEYKKFLETYSKYCRFFLDDFEMKEKYKEAMIEYGSINLPWDNLFEYEIHKIYNNHADTITNDVNNEKDTDEKQSLNSDVKDFLPLDKSLYSTFYENFVIQNFSFPKYIYIFDQELTFNELEFLIKHGGVTELNLESCEIKDENDDYIFLEAITKYLPNIENLQLPNIKINANTAYVLTKQKFNGKLSCFCLKTIYGELFDPIEFQKFIIVANNNDEFFSLQLLFNHLDFDASFVKNVEEIMNDYKNINKKSKMDIDIGFYDF
uniref:Uncharacterized protein n=1 Tax=Panagrolaimus davidi TaxID=227884 RepID=A0A914QZ60_9BILA